MIIQLLLCFTLEKLQTFRAYQLIQYKLFRISSVITDDPDFNFVVVADIRHQHRCKAIVCSPENVTFDRLNYHLLTPTCNISII